LAYLLTLPRNNRYLCAVNYHQFQSCILCTLIQCVRTHGKLYRNTKMTVRILNRPTTNFGAECFELFGRFEVLRQSLQVQRLQGEQWSGFNPRQLMVHLRLVTRVHYFLKALECVPVNYIIPVTLYTYLSSGPCTSETEVPRD
jgi:hypothetical protein